ncbi:MAG: hypothetical protein RSD49_02420 [Hafnia sp.]
MTKRRLAGSVRLRESTFIIRVAIVFMMLGAVLFAATLLSEHYWVWQFDRLYGVDGEVKSATLAADIQAYQALKPLLNITMYAIPKTLGFMSVGFALVGTILIVMEGVSTAWRRYQQRQEHKRAGQ